MSGAVVWVTGLPSAGKSTFALALRDRLAARPCAILDGDEVRLALVPSPGYDPAGRSAFYETLARLGALLARQGLVVLIPATAHLRQWRDEARALAPRYIEVYLPVGAKECARRDTKGLYARARAGEPIELPGGSIAYEPPTAAEVIATGGEDRAALEQVVALLGE